MSSHKIYLKGVYKVNSFSQVMKLLGVYTGGNENNFKSSSHSIVDSFKNKEFTTKQCSFGRNRSIEEMIYIYNTYNPKSKIKLKYGLYEAILNNIRRNSIGRSIIRFRYCPDVDNIVTHSKFMMSKNSSVSEVVRETLRTLSLTLSNYDVLSRIVEGDKIGGFSAYISSRESFEKNILNLVKNYEMRKLQ